MLSLSLSLPIYIYHIISSYIYIVDYRHRQTNLRLIIPFPTARRFLGLAMTAFPSFPSTANSWDAALNRSEAHREPVAPIVRAVEIAQVILIWQGMAWSGTTWKSLLPAGCSKKWHNQSLINFSILQYSSFMFKHFSKHATWPSTNYTTRTTLQYKILQEHV